jgi:hypothetical protein
MQILIRISHKWFKLNETEKQTYEDTYKSAKKALKKSIKNFIKVYQVLN